MAMKKKLKYLRIKYIFTPNADESLKKQICPVTQNVQDMRQLLISLKTYLL